MFSAIRRGRREARCADRPRQLIKRPSPIDVLFKSCQDGIAHASDCAGKLSEEISLHLGAVFEHLQKLEHNQAQTLLYASVSNAVDPKATLPNKNRLQNAAVDSLNDGQLAKDGIRKEDEERILISEVDVVGVEGDLKEIVRNALSTRPNFAYTVNEVQKDVQRVFDTGFFSSCRPKAEDTRDGVRLTIEVTPNPELRGVNVKGASRLPQAIVASSFGDLRGRTLNFNSLATAVARLNRWYEENGVLGQVVDVELASGDVVNVRLAEAVVNRIDLKYVDSKTGESRDEGKTKPEIIMRQLTTKPGQVYSLRQAKADIEAVFSTGLFDDVSIRPQPAEGSTVESPRVDLSLEIKERKKTGGLAAGGGISAAGATEGAMPGFIGTVSYSQRNLFGLGQRLVASAEIGQLDSTFRVAHTDPWVRGDAFRTSRTISAQNTKTSATPIHGRAQDEANATTGTQGDGVFVSRVVGSIEYGRPLGLGWQGSLGLSWQQARCVDEHSRPLMQDVYGGPLMVNRGGKGHDTMTLGTIRVAYTAPAADSELVASMEQAIPLNRDWLNFNRFTVRADKSLPLGPLRLWLSGKGGAIVGDLPPYEAFPIGGTNSVRGYSEGGVGSGRSYVTGTAEVHVPLVSPFEGTLFADYGSDLGSGSQVPGDPAGARQKPGGGYGFGAGVRIDTPIGPLRLEYGVNDSWHRRFHLGIGSHG